MPFTDFYEHAIDAKLRLAIPARHRSERDRLGGSKSWVCIPWKDHLRLYPEVTFQRLAEQQQGTLFAGQDRAELQAAFFGLASQLDEDSVGRISVPKRHLDSTRLPSDVVVIGAWDRLEVRERRSWLEGLERRHAETIERINRLDSGATAPGKP
jgi:MraZ protein